jgi:ABC-type glutathione transport system ATPase component
LTFRQLAREKNLAIIFVTHDLRLTGRCADHVVFMANGTVVEEGPASQLLNHPETAAVRAFLASGSEDDREMSL